MGKGDSSSTTTTTTSTALSEGVLKMILLYYTYVAIYMSLSFVVIVYNKYILDPKMYNL
ncbi:putative sugar phosphate/phosphate translocator [Acorus calamus]|uniref:Sugar phosphate/phosphate translocator n=1 Tax=Acorus calamus TaxID=4465 RepID=A0AAV9DMQ2_ACOCL|nr:putative sugar phosphate/phosphate translocator [Acorus calamus]